MKTIAGNHHLLRAFTLIELLTVIAIIALLATILGPVYGAIITAGKKMAAGNDANQLVMAITAYHTEYSRLPLKDLPKEDPEPIRTEEAFMKILLAEEEADEGERVLNPRGIIFFEGPTQRRPQGHGMDRDGNLFDPWGNPYEIILDGNYDNRIEVLEEEIRRIVGVRSMGPDGRFELPEDNGKSDDITTW